MWPTIVALVAVTPVRRAIVGLVVAILVTILAGVPAPVRQLFEEVCVQATGAPLPAVATAPTVADCD